MTGPADRFEWTAERDAVVERLYLKVGLAVAEIAREIGGGCTARRVTKRINRKGWAKLRPAEFYEAERRAVTAAASQARSQTARAARAPVRCSALGAGRTLPDDLRAAIDQAVAAGRVTRLAPGQAAGLSRMEERFFTAPPPGDADPLQVEANRRGGRRGGGANGPRAPERRAS